MTSHSPILLSEGEDNVIVTSTGSSPAQSTENFLGGDPTTTALAPVHVGSDFYASTVEQDNWGCLQRGGSVCPECGRALCNPNALSRHRKTKHGLGRQWFCRQSNCTKRLKAYGRFDHFKSHMKNCHGIHVSSRDSNAKKRHLLDDSPAQVDLQFPPEPDRSSSNADEFQASEMPSPRVAESSGRAYHDVSATILPGKQAPPLQGRIDILTSMGGSVEDFESVDPNTLIYLLQSEILECERLRKRCKILPLERDEYAEALKMSEEMFARR
ncbi:hypothetical protein GGS26DRAFT_412495 [Hypomontagnella submonticulosa]|nr:hypothetical protein GGS26DRAFT_412495 [Hypomontagnella submonticulosa]